MRMYSFVPQDEILLDLVFIEKHFDSCIVILKIFCIPVVNIISLVNDYVGVCVVVHG